MRFISLSEERVNMLTGIYKYSGYHRVRQRAHCLLPSNGGRTVSELTEIFGADRTTVCNISDAWESGSLAGLYDKKENGGNRSLLLK